MRIGSGGGPGGYTTPSTRGGGGGTSHWGKESKVAHKGAGWLHNPCSLGGPQHPTMGHKIISDPQRGSVAT